MGNYQNGYDYLKSKDDGIRSIDRISVIPEPVYDSNLKVICDALEVLKLKESTRDDKLDASDSINLLTVSIPMYRCKKHNTKKSVDSRYNSIPIVNCKYSKETGIDFEESDSENDDKSETEDNFL